MIVPPELQSSEGTANSPGAPASPGAATSPLSGPRATNSKPSLMSDASYNSSTSEARRKRVSMGGDFHKVEQIGAQDTEGTRTWMRKALEQELLANFLAVVILVDGIMTLIDTDAHAMGRAVPAYTIVVSNLCLATYTIELLANVYVHRASALKRSGFLFDAATVTCGYVAILLSVIAPIPGGLAFLEEFRLLRLVRILRVTRILQKTRSLRELQKLMSMMSTCAKTLGWSFLFCFAFMTVWGMLLVEVVYPMIMQMHLEGHFQDCEYCLRATSSVMDAVLLLFKTVIAGDSWGRIAVPVIQRSPWTAVIFCGSLLTTLFGVLNMVVAVMVDSFAESRQRDVLNLAEEIEHDNKNDMKCLENIFTRLAHGSADLTMEDLVKGAQTDPEFQSRLRVMDIDQQDLEQLFEMIDEDNSGSIQKQEFIRPLSRWIHDSKTAPRFVKYNLERALLQQEEILKQMHQQFSDLRARLDDLSDALAPGQTQEVSLLQTLQSLQSTQTEGVSTLGVAVAELQGTRDEPREVGLEQPRESHVMSLTSRGDAMKNDRSTSRADSHFPAGNQRLSRDGLKHI